MAAQMHFGLFDHRCDDNQRDRMQYCAPLFAVEDYLQKDISYRNPCRKPGDN